jgi:hypothetical protein
VIKNNHPKLKADLDKFLEKKSRSDMVTLNQGLETIAVWQGEMKDVVKI